MSIRKFPIRGSRVRLVRHSQNPDMVERAVQAGLLDVLVEMIMDPRFPHKCGLAKKLLIVINSSEGSLDQVVESRCVQMFINIIPVLARGPIAVAPSEDGLPSDFDIFRKSDAIKQE